MAHISLVIPTRNERDNIVPLLDAVRASLSGRDFEVWIVDDDSPDRTWEVASNYAKSHPQVFVIRRIGERGLSSAVVAGFIKSSGDVLAVMDADLSHDPSLLPRLIDAVDAGADMAVGSRRVPGGGADNWKWHRRKTSDVATSLAKWWLGADLSDPMSGYFALRRSVFESVRDVLQNEGYKILLEIVCRARPKKIVELPYVFQDRRQGVSKLTPKVAAEFLKSLWDLRRTKHRA
jgi:dolichol-phosphate mannosyltransferase